MTPRVICIGSTSKDIFFATAEGQIIKTPEDVTSQVKVAFELGGKFLAKDRSEAVGGVAANMAMGLARLGVKAHCYSKVGHDEIGRWIQSVLECSEVECDTLFIDPKAKSDVSAIVVIEQTADRLIFHNRDANEKLEIIPDAFPEADWLFVSSLNGPWEENFEKILELKRARGLSLALNPGQHNMKENPGLILRSLAEVDFLVMNKDEAVELLLGAGVEKNAERLKDETNLLKAFHREGVPLIGMTDGRRGAWGYDGEELLHAEVFERHGLKDTTGAGDAFSSGFFAAHLMNLPLTAALQYGNANAGSVVGFFGAGEGLLNQEEIHQILKEVKVSHVVSVSGA